MEKTGSVYQKIEKITDKKFGSCDIYHMKPGKIEPKHYHHGIEIVYVLKGNCKTHKQGKIYVYQKGQVHEVINNSKNELVFVCLTIPPESNDNTMNPFQNYTSDGLNFSEVC